MVEVSDEDVTHALKKRRSYIKANLEVLTMKACRKMLEEDMGLPEKSLTSHKEFIQRFVDKVIAKQSDQNNNPDEQGSPEKKRKASASTEQDTKKKKWKKSKAEPEPVAAAAPARSSKTIDQAKRICKQATIKIPPTTYAKSKSLAELEADLEDLLSKHGLSLDASSQYIEKVRRKLEKERELDGLDVSNIVVGDRRARRTAAPINYAAIEAANSSDDDSSEAEQQDSEDKQDAGSDAEDDHGNQTAASNDEASDHADGTSDEDAADPAVRPQDSTSSPKPGHNAARSRNTAINDDSDDD